MNTHEKVDPAPTSAHPPTPPELWHRTGKKRDGRVAGSKKLERRATVSSFNGGPAIGLGQVENRDRRVIGEVVFA